MLVTVMLRKFVLSISPRANTATVRLFKRVSTSVTCQITFLSGGVIAACMEAWVRSLTIVVTHMHDPITLFVGLVCAQATTESKIIFRGAGWCETWISCFGGHCEMVSAQVRVRGVLV